MWLRYILQGTRGCTQYIVFGKRQGVPQLQQVKVIELKKDQQRTLNIENMTHFIIISHDRSLQFGCVNPCDEIFHMP
jgi:hypothetical protein